MKGIHQTTTHDGVHVFRLHYSADPSKDPSTPEGAAWLARELVGYPGGLNDPRWRREMEIDFEAFAGQLLFPYLLEYQDVILCEPVSKIPVHWEVTAGLDYGSARNPSAFELTGWDRKTGNPTTFWEYYQPPKGKEESFVDFRKRKGYLVLAKEIKANPFWGYMQDHEVVITADSSLWNKTQETKHGLKSVADLLQGEGIVMTPSTKGKGSEMAWYEMVSSKLWCNPKVPLWKICKNVTWLWKELQGLRFAEKSAVYMETHNEPDEIVDKANHAVDAVRYDHMSHWQQLDQLPDQRSPQDKRIDRMSRRDVDPFERDFGDDSLARYRESARSNDGFTDPDDEPDEEYGEYSQRPESVSLGMRR